MTGKPRVYIAGPMRGIPYYNVHAFDAAALSLEKGGFIPVSPADLDRVMGVDFLTCHDGNEDVGLPPLSLILRDLHALADCDAVILLEGWESSKGAAVEIAFAEFLGIPVHEWEVDD